MAVHPLSMIHVMRERTDTHDPLPGLRRSGWDADGRTHGRGRIAAFVFAGLAASTAFSRAHGEGEYALPTSKTHIRECYQAVADMKLGKVDQIMGFREREGYHFRLVVKDEHGRRVTATCDGNTGKIVGVQRE